MIICLFVCFAYLVLVCFGGFIYLFMVCVDVTPLSCVFFFFYRFLIGYCLDLTIIVFVNNRFICIIY